jgi:hypothetical protein
MSNYLIIGVDPATLTGLAAQLFDEKGNALRPMVTRTLSMAVIGGDNFMMEFTEFIWHKNLHSTIDEFKTVFGIESYGSWTRARACQSKSSAIYKLLCAHLGKQIGRGKTKVITAYRPKPQEWQHALGCKRGKDTKAFAAAYCKNVLQVDLTGDEADAACIMAWTKTEFFNNLKMRGIK